jgi:hypothetical protein
MVNVVIFWPITCLAGKNKGKKGPKKKTFSKFKSNNFCILWSTSTCFLGPGVYSIFLIGINKNNTVCIWSLWAKKGLTNWYTLNPFCVKKCNKRHNE